MNFLWEREREEFEEDSAWEGRFQAWMGGKRKRKRSLEAWERDRESKKEVPGVSRESQNFQLSVVLLGRAHNLILFENWKLVWMSSLNIVFKHPKMRNVTQTLLNKISYQTFFFFSLVHSFQCLNSENYYLELFTKQALNI